ncbi:four helix bundle suffix domain protein [Limihaloglobus sulfuriphilus]|uniref:Four helix bundle suffix domain protein n=1 Tax=Limihaloglobus sulfuriphilus TaxID=1851148 RepID=A0A1Q2MG10_9BACT|nr:four helix bundle suffix domain-containing protein [Limihaloglobus sulfuriphilus]AQQ71623.1 four helix bundle suffix domain protein [Limihaloglobus sulfuriphilus]
MSDENLIPVHGGYRNLKSFQLAQLVYDITVVFCGRYVDKFSRTTDQMVQAARSGVQNIAEGSQASGTSKKTELKLTSVARASLEELRLDYEDFLRQRCLPQLLPDEPAMMRFKKLRCNSLEQFRGWVDKEKRILVRGGEETDPHRHAQTNTGGKSHVEKFVIVSERPCPSRMISAMLAANAVLSLLNLTCYLLEKQIKSQAKDFEQKGGFTERLYRVRSQKRQRY